MTRFPGRILNSDIQDNMRILGGEKRGLPLKTRKGGKTRPLSARVKTSLFGILAPRLQDAAFYDFFAGNGSVGIEALSRGAVRALFFEKNETCIRIIRENLKNCGFLSRAELVRKDVLKILSTLPPPEKPVICFLGPPYHTPLAHQTLALMGKYNNFPSGTLVIAELSKGDRIDQEYRFFRSFREERYGDTRLVFYENGCQDL